MKKLIYISTISFLLVNLSSCTATKMISSTNDFNKYMKKKDGVYVVNTSCFVLGIKTKSGDTLLFSKGNPGRVSITGVYGKPEVHFTFGTVDSVGFGRATPFSKITLQTIWKGGVQYDLISENSSGYFCRASLIINIPLSEIQIIQIFKFNGKAILIPFTILSGVVLTAIFVYSIINL